MNPLEGRNLRGSGNRSMERHEDDSPTVNVCIRSTVTGIPEIPLTPVKLESTWIEILSLHGITWHPTKLCIKSSKSAILLPNETVEKFVGTYHRRLNKYIVKLTEMSKHDARIMLELLKDQQANLPVSNNNLNIDEQGSTGGTNGDSAFHLSDKWNFRNPSSSGSYTFGTQTTGGNESVQGSVGVGNNLITQGSGGISTGNRDNITPVLPNPIVGAGVPCLPGHPSASTDGVDGTGYSNADDCSDDDVMEIPIKFEALEQTSQEQRRFLGDIKTPAVNRLQLTPNSVLHDVRTELHNMKLRRNYMKIASYAPLTMSLLSHLLEEV